MSAGVFAILGQAGQIASGLVASNARRAEFAEQLRQLQMKKDYTVGLANAKAAGSGFSMSGYTTTEYLRRLTGEFNLALDNLRKKKDLTRTMDIFNLATQSMSTVGSTAGGYSKAQGYTE